MSDQGEGRDDGIEFDWPPSAFSAIEGDNRNAKDCPIGDCENE
jgi:hypothetical protein